LTNGVWHARISFGNATGLRPATAFWYFIYDIIWMNNTAEFRPDWPDAFRAILFQAEMRKKQFLIDPKWAEPILQKNSSKNKTLLGVNKGKLTNEQK
jgi:hypothetical protein